MSSLRTTIGRLAVAGVVVIAVVEVALIVVGRGDGPFAVLQVLAPHLALIGLGLALVAIAVRWDRVSIGVAAALVATVGLRFGGDWLSLPVADAAGSGALEVVTWNLEA